VLRAFEALLRELEAIELRTDRTTTAALVQEGKALDVAHDGLVRGLIALFDASALLDPERAHEYARLSEHVFPLGLRTTQRTYADEADEGRRAEGRLDDADRALLRALPLRDGRTAADVFAAWVASCAALDRFERKRLAAEAPAGVTPAQMLDVRNRWIRAVHAFEAQVALSGGTHGLLDAIRAIEEKADHRGGSEPTQPIPA
jgi:hypothetical protein